MNSNNSNNPKQKKSCKPLSKQQERVLASAIIEESNPSLTGSVHRVKRIIPGSRYIELVF